MDSARLAYTFRCDRQAHSSPVGRVWQSRDQFPLGQPVADSGHGGRLNVQEAGGLSVSQPLVVSKEREESKLSNGEITLHPGLQTDAIHYNEEFPESLQRIPRTIRSHSLRTPINS